SDDVGSRGGRRTQRLLPLVVILLDGRRFRGPAQGRGSKQNRDGPSPEYFHEPLSRPCCRRATLSPLREERARRGDPFVRFMISVRARKRLKISHELIVSIRTHAFGPEADASTRFRRVHSEARI